MHACGFVNRSQRTRALWYDWIPNKVVLYVSGKSFPPKKDLSAAAEETLAQIDRQNYTWELKERGVRKIVKYGIAFSGKAAVVKTAE